MVAGLLLTFDCARRLTDGLHGLIALSVLPLLVPAVLRIRGAFVRALLHVRGARSLAVDENRISERARGNLLWRGAFARRHHALLRGDVSGAVRAMGSSALEALAASFLKAGRRRRRRCCSGRAVVAADSLVFAQVFLRLLEPAVLRGASGDLPAAVSRRSAAARADHGLDRPLGDERRGHRREADEAGEAIGWLFLCIPLAGFVLAELGTNAFFSRYFICVLPGAAVAFACLLWRNFARDYRVSLGIFLLLAGWGGAKQMAVARNPQSVEATGIREFLSLEPVLRAEGKRYMVFSPPLIFSEAQYYSSHPDDCILLLPPDFDQPTEALSAPDPYLHQRLLLNLSQFYPLQIWRPYSLKEYAPEVALIEPSQDVLEALRRDGFQLRIRFSTPLKVVYLQ